MKIKDAAKQFWKTQDPSQNDHVKWYLQRLQDNCNRAEKIYSRCYITIGFLALLYFCIFTGALSEVSFLSLKFKNINLLKWIIPLLSAFLFYQGVCAFVQSRYLQDIISEFIEKYLPKIFENSFEFTIYGVSTFNLERFIVHRGIKGKSVSLIFALTIGLIGIIFPVLILFVYSVLNFRHLSFQPFPWIQTTLIGIAWIIVLRSPLFVWSFWHEFK